MLLRGAGEVTSEQKLDQIGTLLERFPRREFILIGDAGERDPEIYAALRERFPTQVREILIRAVAGAGPGDPGLLTLRGWQRLLAADAVVYDRLAATVLPCDLPAHVELHCVGKTAGNHPVPQEEITALLADPEVQGDSNRFRELSREFAQVEPLSLCYARYLDAEQELQNAEEMLADPMIRLVMQADGVSEVQVRHLYSGLGAAERDRRQAGQDDRPRPDRSPPRKEATVAGPLSGSARPGIGE